MCGMTENGAPDACRSLIIVRCDIVHVGAMARCRRGLGLEYTCNHSTKSNLYPSMYNLFY